MTVISATSGSPGIGKINSCDLQSGQTLFDGLEVAMNSRKQQVRRQGQVVSRGCERMGERSMLEAVGGEVSGKDAAVLRCSPGLRSDARTPCFSPYLKVVAHGPKQAWSQPQRPPIPIASQRRHFFFASCYLQTLEHGYRQQLYSFHPSTFIIIMTANGS